MRCSLAVLLIALGCAAKPVLLPDATPPADNGPCGGACGAGTVCQGGMCVAADAGGVDAPTIDAGMDAGQAMADVPTVIDVSVAVDAGPRDAGGDVGVDAGFVCRDPASLTFTRRCASNAECDPCAPTSPLTATWDWCCGVTGFCQERVTCGDNDGGVRGDAQVSCGAAGLVPCERSADCNACAPTSSGAVWCCADGNCGTRSGRVTCD